MYDYEEDILTQNATLAVDKYGHDAFFHYLVTKHDGIRLTLCQKMISEHKIIETHVQNSMYYPTHYDGKKFVLDILAKDEEENLYNIEMQCYTIDEEQLIRFQLYSFRVLSRSAKKGENYKEIKPLRQMIINTSEPIKGLNDYMHHFTMYDKVNKVDMPYSRYEVFLVQLGYLDMESISIEEFDELMYLFKTDSAYDKIEVHKNVSEAIAMHNEYLISPEHLAAIERERDEMARQIREEVGMRKAEEKGLARGMAKGMAKGLEEGMAKGLEEGMAKGMAKGLEEGMAKGLEEGMAKGKASMIIHVLSQKLGMLSQPIQQKILTLSAEQLEKLTVHLFDIENEEDIFKYIV